MQKSSSVYPIGTVTEVIVGNAVPSHVGFDVPLNSTVVNPLHQSNEFDSIFDTVNGKMSFVIELHP